MRHIRQLLPEECAREILSAGSNGVLSLVDSDGEPYGVPLSFAYDNDGYIYFHSALEGHKIECIKADGRCSLEAIELVRKRI